MLARETGLPISLEHHYKFVVLLPLEADQRMEALKHYFGITYDGELVARGIEIRRHDVPNFIKEFQTELVYTLFDCNDSAEVISNGYENSLLLVTQTIDRIMTGAIQLQDLVVSKLLGQDLDKYKSLFPHVSAAIQLTRAGKSRMAGNAVEYIYTDSRHSNPLCRVTPSEFMEVKILIMIRRNIRKCCLKLQKRSLDPLALIGASMGMQQRRKLGNGGMSLAKKESETERPREFRFFGVED